MSSILSPQINVVLVEPQIPPNTGNIARLCAAMNCPLHLVEPLGFSLSDKQVRRAGLDYWPEVDLQVHASLNDFFAKYPHARCFFLSTKVKTSYTRAQFLPNDFLVFGSETKGLPESLLKERAESTLTIPMTGKVRSLNLSSSVAMVLGEALRQTTWNPSDT